MVACLTPTPWRTIDHLTKAKALQKAHLEVMSDYPEPFFWAAFTLYGDGETNNESRPVE
jgi:hypothetical protein